MMKTANHYDTRLRKALSFGRMAALGPLIRPAPARAKNQDSALLILCAEFHRTQADLDHWFATGWELEPSPSDEEADRLWRAEKDRLCSANRDIYNEIIDMPAQTLAGIVAKSKVLAAHMERDVMGNSGIGDHELFAYKLAQETAQFAGAAA